MADYRSYRRKKLSNNYLVAGYGTFAFYLKRFSSVIVEFEMYEEMFNMLKTYKNMSKNYSIISYFDLKDKTIDVKILEKDSKKTVYFDTYSLTQTSYLIMRETRNYKNGLYTKTVANPVKKYHHASFYLAKKYNRATKLLENKVVIIRNKTDFLNNFDCYYVVKDENTNGKYMQIESNISSQLLDYNNQTILSSTSFGAVLKTESEKGVVFYKSNRDKFYNDKTMKYNHVSEPITSKNILEIKPESSVIDQQDDCKEINEKDDNAKLNTNCDSTM